eukprot:CAMPEP_0118941834 /NCGR_PEP_ID=MMETSP1169-20130426/34780_1 /TAXON_ID=36882 /ORGANISM="Pyramimonas obovata, Strain CCMP722" /LENGTH=50 /DNA_ID=CAMNT_0006886695 /DNA_START=179 /DNA_END=328 /DNA_ORIENTATION=+
MGAKSPVLRHTLKLVRDERYVCSDENSEVYNERICTVYWNTLSILAIPSL